MTIFRFLFLIPVLVVCGIKNNNETLQHSNRFYSTYYNYNEKTYEIDSVIVADKKGKRDTYALEKDGVGEYPGLYKDRLISLIYGREYTDLITFNLVTHQTDTLFSNVQVLETSAMDEYDGMVVIRDASKYVIVDVEKKKVLKESDCNLENILLVDSTYFLVRTLNNHSEPKPYLCRGSISGTEDTKLINISGMGTEYYLDATTNGWNGMAICKGVLFIHMMKGIVAYDIQQNKIAARIDEDHPLTYKVKSGKPTFAFEKDEIIFDFKAKQFKRL